VVLQLQRRPASVAHPEPSVRFLWLRSTLLLVHAWSLVPIFFDLCRIASDFDSTKEFVAGSDDG
jgi:hypothetical protein